MDSLTTNSNDPRRICNFDEFSFDAEKRILWCGTETVQLAPKACELLAVLIENAPQVLSKEELMNQVWNDSFVEEANLTHHISALRKALGEDKTGRRFIETIPRKGYRFVAEVKNAANSESAEIVFNERAVMQIVEETTFETNNLPLNSATLPTTLSIAPIGLPPLPSSTQKNPHRLVWTLAAATFVLLIGAAAFLAYRNFSSASKSVPPEIKIKRLTPDADADSASVSPDGASVVFDRVENGRHGLWRKQIASGEMTQLMPDVSMHDVAIGPTRFSPDGRWIYYTQLLFRENEETLTIYRIPAGGGTAQKILSDLALGTDFSISPDGRQIAYAFDWRQVIVADIETGNKQIIVDWDGIKRYVRSKAAAWSSDGSRLIFSGGEIKDNNANFQLLEINLKTKELRQIPISEKFSVWQIEWLPDDSGLVVTHGNEIWFVNHHTGETRRISRENDNFDDLRISDDGKTIVATQRLGQFHIWTAPADDIEKRRQITIGAAAMHGVGGLAQMPDGRILYTSTESGATDIWMLNADGGDRKQLTNSESEPGSFAPQPTKDGRYIVFRSHRSGLYQVWRMDADGKNPVQLSTAVESYDHSLSPEDDVYYISFLADEQKYQIYKVPVEGGEPVRLDELYSESAPQFSPDGKWILFFGGKTKDEKPRNAIVERTTSKIIRYFDIFGRWSPDSKSIIFKKNDGKELWRQPIDGSAAEKIYDFHPLRIAQFNFSADGKRIVFSLGNSTSEVVMIQNFSENAK